MERMMTYCPGCESVDYRINPVHTLIKRSFFYPIRTNIGYKLLNKIECKKLFKCYSIVAPQTIRCIGHLRAASIISHFTAHYM